MEVQYRPAGGFSAAAWTAITAAQYDEPSQLAVLMEAIKTWQVVFDIVGRAEPDALLVAGQHWTDYVLLFEAKSRHVAAMAARLDAAKSEAGRGQALQSFSNTVELRVYETQAQRFIDEEEFARKYLSK